MNRFQRITYRFLVFLTVTLFCMIAALRTKAASLLISPSTSVATPQMQDDVSTTNSNPVNQGNPVNQDNPVNDGNDLSNSNVVSNVVSDAEMSITDSDKTDDTLRTRANPDNSCYNSLPTSGSEWSLATQEDEAGWNGYLVNLTIDEHRTKKESMARKGRRLIDALRASGDPRHHEFIRKDSTVNTLLGEHIEDAILGEEVRLSQYMQNGVFVGEPLQVDESMLNAVRNYQTTYRDGMNLLNPPNPPNPNSPNPPNPPN